jgi:hypothetical protein
VIVIGKLTPALKYLLHKDVPGRNLQVYPDDTFVVSYPKAGNTWTRFLIANLVHPQERVTLLTADRLIPAVDGQSRRYFRGMPRPRIIKSHYAFHPSYQRVVYIVRDPRDVAVSQYYYQIKRTVLADGYPIEEFVTRFVAGRTCPYGSWGENVASWLAARQGSAGFLLLRYEDMVAQPLVQASRIASFLGLHCAPELIAQAVKRSSAERMRELERLESRKWNSTKGTRQDLSFVRHATSGSWRATLTQPCVAAVEAAWSPLMRWLGYDLGEESMACASPGPLKCLLEKPAP